MSDPAALRPVNAGAEESPVARQVREAFASGAEEGGAEATSPTMPRRELLRAGAAAALGLALPRWLMDAAEAKSFSIGEFYRKVSPIEVRGVVANLRDPAVHVGLTVGFTGEHPGPQMLSGLARGYAKASRGQPPVFVGTASMFNPGFSESPILGAVMTRHGAGWDPSDLVFLNVPAAPGLTTIGIRPALRGRGAELFAYVDGRPAYSVEVFQGGDGEWVNPTKIPIVRVGVPVDPHRPDAPIAMYRHPLWRKTPPHAPGLDVIVVPVDTPGGRQWRTARLIEGGRGGLVVPPGGMVLALPTEQARQYGGFFGPWKKLVEHLTIPRELEADGVTQIFPGGRLILRGGRLTEEAQTHGFLGGEKRPGVIGGISSRRTLLVVGQDGKVRILFLRRPDGQMIRVEDVERLLSILEIPAEAAVELDGGGSLGYWYEGRMKISPDRGLPVGLIIARAGAEEWYQVTVEGNGDASSSWALRAFRETTSSSNHWRLDVADARTHKPIGWMRLSDWSEERPGVWRLEYLHVEPALRGRRYTTPLLETAMRWVGERGGSLRVFVEVRNLLAVSSLIQYGAIPVEGPGQVRLPVVLVRGLHPTLTQLVHLARDAKRLEQLVASSPDVQTWETTGVVETEEALRQAGNVVDLLVDYEIPEGSMPTPTRIHAFERLKAAPAAPTGAEEQASTFLVVGPTALRAVPGIEEALDAAARAGLEAFIRVRDRDEAASQLPRILGTPGRVSVVMVGAEEDAALQAMQQRLMRVSDVTVRREPPAFVLPFVGRITHALGGVEEQTAIERAADDFFATLAIAEAA